MPSGNLIGNTNDWVLVPSERIVTSLSVKMKIIVTSKIVVQIM